MNTNIMDLNSEWPANNDVGCPPCKKSVACPLPSEQAGVAPLPSSSTLGRHLARRLVEVGVTDVFSVPGDFNLTLLDHLLAEPALNLIGCCNELNAGYAADGYARSRGVGACVATFTVGGLSIINAIAGAYSENLPVICIVGGLILTTMEPTAFCIIPLGCLTSVIFHQQSFWVIFLHDPNET